MVQRVAHAREPARGRSRGARRGRSGRRCWRPAGRPSSEIWSAPSPSSPGSTLLERRDQVVLGVREDLGDVADHEERQGEDREERQEREVGHRRRPAAALHAAVVLLRPDRVVERGGRRCRRSVDGAPWPGPSATPRLRSPPAPRTRKSRRRPASPRPRRGRRGGTPSTSNEALEVGQLGEGLVQLVVGEVVGDGDVRVVGELEVDARAGPAHGGGELLAAARSPRRGVTNTTGETGRKVPVPRRCTRNGSSPPRPPWPGGSSISGQVVVGRSRSAGPA